MLLPPTPPRVHDRRIIMPKRTMRPKGDEDLEAFFVPTGLDPDYDDADYFDELSKKGSNKSTPHSESGTDEERVKPSHQSQKMGRAHWDDAAEAKGQICIAAIAAAAGDARARKRAILILTDWLKEKKYMEKWGVTEDALAEVGGKEVPQGRRSFFF